MKLPNAKSRILPAFFWFLSLGCFTTNADIVSVGGGVVVTGVPPSLEEGRLEDDIDILIFQEQAFLAVKTGFEVDVTAPGFVDEESELSSSHISPPITVDTYLLHFDPLDDGPAMSSGSVTFDVEIIGVIVLQSSLNDSDSILGNSMVLYPSDSNETNRGLELRGTDPTGDAFCLSSDFRTLTIERLSATGWVDQVRIVTLSPRLLLGDVNCDGEVNLLDVAPFVDLLTAGTYSIKADINQDGSVNLLDVAPFVELLTGG